MSRTGLENLLYDDLSLLRGRRVGLITHPAAILPDCTAALDALLAAGVQVTTLFGLEHGLTGAVADGVAVGDERDRRTGLSVFSLYGAVRAPTAAWSSRTQGPTATTSAPSASATRKVARTRA